MSRMLRSIAATIALILGFTGIVEKLASDLKAHKMGPEELATANGGRGGGTSNGLEMKNVRAKGRV